MTKDVINLKGIITKTSHDIFVINVLNDKNETTDHVINARPSGKIRQNKIKIIINDVVNVELSPYDLTKGRITYRY